jgi:hypothetical protein
MLRQGDVALVASGISNTIPYLSKLPVVIVIRNREISCLNFESLVLLLSCPRAVRLETL